MVPLAEAWGSGARSWTARAAQSYANDLGDARSLVAVTDNVNQSKGDQDPAEWMPTYDKCRYLREWVAVKIRWRLSVDSAEKTALRTWRRAAPTHHHGDARDLTANAYVETRPPESLSRRGPSFRPVSLTTV